jgi:drug/metabolite transporter (DMT)-like permease
MTEYHPCRGLAVLNPGRRPICDKLTQSAYSVLREHMPYTGELAGIATALLWSATSTFFTLAGRRVGSVVVNRMRLLFAATFLMVTHWLVFGSPVPIGVGSERWLWFGLSGLVGLVLGDSFLFQAFIWIGPRLSMLMMSLAPVLAALLSWVVLGERLMPMQVMGIGLSVGGVAAVVADRRNHRVKSGERDSYSIGILFGLGAATGQALGLILAKKGLEGIFPALSGNLMRMICAASVMWVATLFQRKLRETFSAVKVQQGALRYIVAGSIVGPFLGVWLSLIAIQWTEVGVASTLMGLAPIFLLPIGHYVFGEKIGWQAIFGTIVAMVGVGVLFQV